MTGMLFIDPARHRTGQASHRGEALYMLVADGEVQGDGAERPAIAWVERSAIALADDAAWWVRLGTLEGRERYAAIRIGETQQADSVPFRPARHAGFLSLFQLGRCAPAEQQFAARAAHLASWLHRSRFCGSCGHGTDYVTGLNKMVCRNAACGASTYPRVEPAVIMLVVCGDSCLLARQNTYPAGYFAPLAGFVEAGETPEQAVGREVMEEVGLVLDSVEYLGAQPWPFPGSLMLGFIATAAPGQQISLSDEIAETVWAGREQIAEVIRSKARQGPLLLPPAGVIGRMLIDQWMARAS